VLSNPEKRARFDAVGPNEFLYDLSDAEILEHIRETLKRDYFSELENKDFLQGNNVEYRLTITFMEAVNGTEKKIEYPARVTCTTCYGVGAPVGAEVKPCVECKSMGYKTTSGRIMQQQTSCLNCGGYGSTIKNACKMCKGRGTIMGKRKLLVKVPAGIDDDHDLRVKDKGDVGDRNSGKSGILFLPIMVEKHEKFYRNKKDIHVDVPISVTQATLGDTVVVPTLQGGTVQVAVLPGTQPDSERILSGKGIQGGKQVVHFKVHVPTKVTKKQKESIRLFTREEEQKPTLWAKIKKVCRVG